MLARQVNLLEQRNLIEQYLKENPQSLSAFSFVSIFAWKDFLDYEILKLDGSLCIFAKDEAGTFMYLPPLGRNVKPATIDQCFELMHERNNPVGKAHGVSRIENVDAKRLNLFPEKKFKRTLKAYEYCYYRKDLVALKGNDYKSKRNDYNYFIKHYQPEYLPFSFNDKEECWALYDQWSAGRKKWPRDEAYLYMLEDNRQVQQTILKNYDVLELVGRVVRVKGKIAGYTLGYPLSENMFCVLFEIADLNFKGLSVYLFREFCNDPKLAGFPFVNAMDDFALENIQKTKLSFRPRILFPSYTLAAPYI